MINDMSMFHSNTSNTSNSPVILIYCRVLERIISSNNERVNSTLRSKFDLKSSPGLTFYNFLDRIVKLWEIDDNTLIYSMLLIDEFCRTQQKIKLSITNIYLVMLSSLYISLKLLHDVLYQHEIYAKMSGISNKRLSELESLFLETLDFRVHFDDKIFILYESLIRQLN